MIDASNNLGIGVTPSAWGSPGTVQALQIKNTSLAASGTNAYWGSNWYFGSSDQYIAGGTVSASLLVQTGGSFVFSTAGTPASHAAGDAITFTTAMTLGASGSLTVPNIYTNTTAAVTYVAVSSAGLLQRGGVSSLKYKQDIRDLESIDINKFRPVIYKSKCENDDQTIDYFGFIADEVEEAGIKELVTYNDAGEPEGFQYERMTVVLLKAIQELLSQVSDLKEELNEIKAKVN